MTTEEFPVLSLCKALTIATSDSGGGAGIQADLKTFAALGVFGLTVVCGVTAQNTVAVTGFEAISPGMIKAQLSAVFDDIGVDAVKIGLMGDRENALAVAEYLSGLEILPQVVLDPVMVSAGGHNFLSPEAIEGLKSVIPLATVVTPNLYEAAILSGTEARPDDPAWALEAAKRILDLGPGAVLVKGGHFRGPESRDVLLLSDKPESPTWFVADRIDTSDTHGTGCTLSSAIAACLSWGESDLESSVDMAKSFVTDALHHPVRLGRGPGPLNHFHEFYEFEKEESDDA